MPLYEYACRKCAHTFEVLVTGTRTTATACPACASPEVERLIGLPAPRRTIEDLPATNCRGDGPPCGAPWCGRKT